MKLATLGLTLLAFACMPMGAFAQSSITGATSKTVSTTSQRQLEDYYFHAHLGFSLNYYPTETQQAVKDVAAMAGITRIPYSAELGTYWPLEDKHTIVGAVIGGTGENFSKKNADMSLEVVQLTASVQHYLTNTIGDGLYVRGDLGIAGAYLQKYTGSNTESTTETSSGNIGFAAAGSVGYAFPLSSGTSLSLSLNANYRRLPGYETGKFTTGDDIFERGNYTALAFGANLLW